MEQEENNKLHICRAPRCRKNGSDQIVEVLEKVLKTKIDQNSGDAMIELESTHCLGQCAYGPNIRANNKIYTGVDKPLLKRVLVIMKSRLTSNTTQNDSPKGPL